MITGERQDDTGPIAPKLVIDRVKGDAWHVVLKDDASVIHSDKFDIRAGRHRKRFLDDVQNKAPGFGGELLGKIEQDLLDEADRLLEESSESKDGSAGTPVDVEALLNETPEDVRQEAEAMLHDPMLLERVIDDVQRLGVAGEDNLIASLYVCYTSRMLPKPVSVTISSASGSGKSYIARRVAETVPPEGLFDSHQLSPKVLWYLGQDCVKHKVLLMGEKSHVDSDGEKELRRLFREVLADGYATRNVTETDQDVRRGVSQRIDGPICLVDSTTRTDLNHEDTSRVLTLRTDESEDQTARVLKNISEKYSRKAAGRSSHDRIIQAHHCAQRLLKPCPIVVPFADCLSDLIQESGRPLELRRSVGQLLAFVEACCLLHQRQRDSDIIDGEEHIVASLNDYAIAAEVLASWWTEHHAGTLPKACVAFLEKLKEWFPDGQTFTLRNIIDRGRSKSTANGHIASLVRAGCVEEVGEHRGRGHQKTYKLADDPNIAEIVLPSVEQICQALEQEQASG